MNKKYAAILLLAAAAVWTSGPPADIIIAAGKTHTGHESPFCSGHQNRF